MNDFKYLTYLINPYNLDTKPRLFLKKKGKRIAEIKIDDFFQENSTIVSYQLEDLFSFFPEYKNISSFSFIDLSHIARLLYGKPYKGQRSREPWIIWNLLNKEFGESERIKALWNYIYQERHSIDENEIIISIEELSSKLEQLWQLLETKLEESREKDRYFTVEKKTHEILLKRQTYGIRISQETLLEKLDKLDTKIKISSKILRDVWQIRDPWDLDETREILKSNGFTGLSKFSNPLTFNSVLEIHAENHRLPKYIKIYRNSRRDKQILLRLGSIGSERVFPIFKSLGTVTGRILVETPTLQYIKRINRDIMIPDNGKTFLYPDYSQFEPGIMADDSQDENLIEDFNSGDLYTSLSVKLFSDKSNRRSAKILFLGFCFGMKRETMIELASENTSKSPGEVSQIIDDFFGKYKKLNSWAAELENILKSEGRVGTRLGNFRYRTTKQRNLTNEEKRWMISQRIQGTAALILKRVIMQINEKCKDIEILLPMHDALLLQVPIDDQDILKKEIEEIFKAKFLEECPTITPHITFESFEETEDDDFVA